MFLSRPSSPRHTPHRGLAFVAVGVVATAAAAPGLAAATATAAPVARASDSPAAERVLQSVAVDMAPDGTFTRVTGSTVSTSDGSDVATTRTQSYSPDDVVHDLPVRVLTAYRTADGSGTDLSDLAGHTGRVEIDLTVQNLTMRPQNLTYDVAGASRSQAALVGAPLTVVASTALEGVKPSSVVTPTGTKKESATNGVLSQSADGTTQVQWATILAPPQIGSSATLTLVVDAEDFKAPDFDLSVQPGLVTDPSVGALVDAAFQPGSSSEMKLQARTIGLVGEVNTVLARAGETISQVRSTLDSSADTLGTKTVSDLKSSAVGVASSMRGLDGSVKSLGQDLSSSLKSTRSSALEQLLQTVKTLDTMLGDTSAKPHAAAVRGQGCAINVAAPQRSNSVYGNIVAVAGQLSGYAHATDSCKTSLQQSILASVGPANPTAQSCTSADSVTCALFGARASFGKVSDKLVASGADALQALKPATVTDAVDAADALSSDVDSVEAARNLIDAGPLGNVDMTPVDEAVSAAHDSVLTVGDALRGIHGYAENGKRSIDDMLAQNSALAAELCELGKDGLDEPAKLDTTTVERLRAHLVTTNCDGSAMDPVPANAMVTLIGAQSAAWDQVLAASNTQSGATAEALAGVHTRIDEVKDAVVSLKQTVRRHGSDLGERLGELDKKVKALKDARDEMRQRITLVQQQQDKAIADVKAAFQKAADDAKANVDNTVDPQIRQVTTRSAQSRESLGQMFDQSAKGLASAAGRVTSNGAKTLESQKRSFATEQRAAGVRISGQVQDGLSSIAQGVTSSTRDMEAAGALLRQDLTKVLLDLGDRKVNGSGLLGAMTTGAATARSADYQLALATDKTTSYASVHSADIAGLLLRQAQSDAALQMAADLPAFRTDLPTGTEHRTVYTFHVGTDS